MFLREAIVKLRSNCFPRVRGDVPASTPPLAAVVAFSPRARGCSSLTLLSSEGSRVFPACAGMFLSTMVGLHGGY